MQYSSAVLEAVITELTRLPGLGRKSAQRIAFHLLRTSEGDAKKLAQAILDLKSRVEDCRVCGNVTETQPCAICSDPRRDPSILCVVEQPMDVLALERTGADQLGQLRPAGHPALDHGSSLPGTTRGRRVSPRLPRTAR